MPSQRCSFSVNGTLAFVPTASKPEGTLAGELAAAGGAG